MVSQQRVWSAPCRAASNTSAHGAALPVLCQSTTTLLVLQHFLPTQQALHCSLLPAAVPLKMIANFKRVKGLTKELSVVTEALKGSSMLSVDEEGGRVRRTTPLPAYDTTDICRRTVVAEHLPDKPTIGAQQGHGEGSLWLRVCLLGVATTPNKLW